MRARFNKNAKSELNECTRFIDSKEKLQEILKREENKNKKIYIEVGMGKGDFIYNISKSDKENIYIGIELCIPIIALAIKKISRLEESENIKLKNLYLMSFDAIKLSEIFDKHQIDKIYLNFSDPWPKKRHIKRRLTYETFLNEYKNVLIKDGIIEFKTDNQKLFEYSLINIQNFGFEFKEVYLDLHKEEIPNIKTEYEEKFSKFGPIYKLVMQVK